MPATIVRKYTITVLLLRRVIGVAQVVAVPSMHATNVLFDNHI